MPPRVAVLAAALGTGLLWSYWPTFLRMADRWSQDPQFSHGYVVPAFAALVLWFRRKRFPAGPPQPTWWGLAFLVAAAAIRLIGSYFYLDGLDGFSLTPTAAGVTLLLGGWPLLRWGWPTLVFLVLMVPPPYHVELFVTEPLLRAAVAFSTYSLQTLGLPAIAEGNIIVIDEMKIGVLEACSGLGMLVTFAAIAAAVAFIVQRPAYEKAALFLSAVPIGVLMNCIRITATGVLYQLAGSAAAQAFFHSFAGWLMMPLAVAVLWLELRLFSALLIDTTPKGPAPLPRRATAPGDSVPSGSVSEDALLEVPHAVP
jgi:exosortase